MVTAKPSLLLFNAVNTHVIEQGNKYKDILVVASYKTIHIKCREEHDVKLYFCVETRLLKHVCVKLKCLNI